MQGFLLVDKPDGMTSHDVVDRIRRYTGIRKVGHAGTLDPFATGLLIVGVGRGATREMQKLSGLDKKYDAIFSFGGKSDTDDRTGRIEPAPISKPTPEELSSALIVFRGPIEQLPPAYSAIKIGGKKMYEAAREGKPLKASPRSVTIHDLLITKPLEDNKLGVHIHSSTGTYIRAIARDLGEALGGGGYVEELRRTAVGPFEISEATALDALEGIAEEKLIPVEEILGRL
jgi:tRNA pseudouridine55 synthase